jgi:hypothetical protein
VSIPTNSVSRVGLSAIPCIAAKRVQKVTIVSKATTLRIGITVVVSTYSGTTCSSVGRSTIGNRGGIDSSDEKSKDNSVKHFEFFVVGVGVGVVEERNYRNRSSDNSKSSSRRRIKRFSKVVES